MSDGASASFDAPVVQSPTAVTAEIDGQLVALDDRSGVCFGLNRVATRIWRLIETPTSPRELCRTLTAEFDVDEGVCREQVGELIAALREADLIV